MIQENLNGGIVRLTAQEGKCLYRLGETADMCVSSVVVSADAVEQWGECDAALCQGPTVAEYEAEVERLIRERYTVSQELAALRQRDTKPEEFAEYNAYAETCKAKARATLPTPADAATEATE